MIYGLSVLRVCYGHLHIFFCNIYIFLNGFSILFSVITVAMYTFSRFMFVCIWKRMRQMDDNLIVRIATIQALFMCLLIQAATWLQLQRQATIPVSFLWLKLHARYSSPLAYAIFVFPKKELSSTLCILRFWWQKQKPSPILAKNIYTWCMHATEKKIRNFLWRTSEIFPFIRFGVAWTGRINLK